MKLRTKISIIFVFVILIPLAIVNIILVVNTEGQLRESSLSTLQSLAEETGEELNRFILSEQNQFEIIAKNPVLQCKNRNCTEKLTLLEFMKDLHDVYEDITLLNLEGRVIASTDYNYRGEWTSNEWFKKALNGSHVVSDATIITHPTRVIISFISPVFTEKGNLTAVLAGQMNFREIWKLLDNITIGETGFVSLIDHNGLIISHPIKTHIFSEIKQDNPLFSVLLNKTGTATYLNANNITYIAGFTPLFGDLIYNNDGGMWGLIVSQDANEVLAGVTSLQQQMILVSIIFLIVYIVVVNLFSKHFINPIYSLADGMKAVAHGNLNTQVSISSGDEIEYLRKNWKQVIENAPPDTQKTPAVAFLRSSSRPVAFKDNTVVLAFKFKIHKDNMEKPQNQQIAERIISNYLGFPCNVRCIYQQENNHLVEAALKMGAQIVNVEEK